ncbi:MAG TPA: LuxR C-terminal-related transcriptional regulator [Vicinamibacterales bacterium]|nr:LuxR C-terminal-related transcriptional regulator [Vicinamibacterales bacterium]
MAESRPLACRDGDAALARGDWASARAAFLASGDTAEALEGLGLACWWLDEEATVFDARERAYKQYVDAGDRRSAGRVAVWIAWDCAAFRGESAVANGWLQRARRLLEGFPDSAETAWLEARESQIAMAADPERAHRHASEGVRAARAAGAFDLEMLNRSLQGLALVSTGAVAEGMRLLDEVNAAIVGGELSDRIAIGLSGCYMLVACDRVRDYDRAVEWCTRLKAYCEKWGLHPLFAVCRTQYASICLWRGTWLEAEQELTAATRELAASRPAMTVDGLVRLAELRRRQGRLVEASSLFEQSAQHPAAALGLAELAFDRGDVATAAELAERYLRRVPGNNPTQRAIALDLLVRARAGTGDREGARTALAELQAIAARVDTPPLRAAACLAAVYVALAAGDADTARRHAEDALDLFLRSAAPFEVARARIELAKALAALGRDDQAVEEAQRAIDLLAELGAELDIARARTIIASCSARDGRAAPAPPPQRAGLTSREVEVLRLVADGLNNQVIADRLCVSEHTIHRHVANILNKLSVSSRAAAVAQAARRGIL